MPVHCVSLLFMLFAMSIFSSMVLANAKVVVKPGHVIVTSSWDDGDRNDVRMIDILKKYHAKGTFFLYPKNYVLLEQDQEAALAVDPRLITPFSKFIATYTSYKGVEVGAHTYSHPDPRKLPPEELAYELQETKFILENWFKRPITGMAYPYGAVDARVLTAVAKAGYQYARRVENTKTVYPVKNPLEVYPTVHFKDPKFWDEFERVKREGGVFYFWGHSHEINTPEDWQRFDAMIARLSKDSAVTWKTNGELFSTSQEITAKPAKAEK